LNNLVRAAAAKALGRCGNVTTIDRLVRLLAENSDAVRYMAAASIVRLTIEKVPKPAATPASSTLAAATP
jgi:HEAT repeat protein